MSLSRKTKLSFAETEIAVSIINAYPQPAWIIDADDLHICFTNGAAVRAYGYTEEEFLSFCFTDLLHNDDAEAFRQKVSSSEIQFTIATEQRSKSGKFIQG